MADNRRERSGRMECKLLNIDKFNSWTDYVEETKIDGIGAIFLVENGVARGLSTTQLPLENVSHICRWLEKLANRYPDWDNRFFDGEVLMSGMPQPEAQNVTSGLVQKLEYDPRSENIHFHIWDTLLSSEYNDRDCELTYLERKKVLGCLFDQISGEDNKLLHHVWYIESDNKEEFLVIFNDFISHGNEGVVLKRKDSFYSYTKCNDWYKYKPFKEGDFKIVNALEGKGRLVGSLGKFKCEGWLQPDGNISPVKKNDTDVLIRATPGTGISDIQRKQYWKEFQEGTLIGKVIEVKHEGITAYNSLKFAVFMRERKDKNV